MKKLVAGFAVFGFAALIAAYVTQAPLAVSGPEALRGLLALFDQGASRLSEIGGRGAAILALLGGGLVLGMIVAALVGNNGAGSEEDDSLPPPGPVWRPDPLPREDRIASLRRRAGAEAPEAELPGLDADAVDRAPQVEAPASPPPPVVFVRKVRQRGGDWTGSSSWLGGLPRLGGAEWPRDASGCSLPFAAQIDLAELAAACPASPLPQEGSLAFFLGTGAVIAVPPGGHDFTPPPANLPPACDEGGAPFPAAPTCLTRHVFPFWPVEPVILPDEARREGSAGSSPALIAEGDGRLWWHGVFHLAERLHETLDGADRIIEAEARLEREALETLAELEGDPHGLPEAVADARRKVEEVQARREDAEREAAALPAMVEALDGFTANRNPWEPLTPEERDLVVDILDEIHRRHGKLVQHSLPHSLAPLQALCIRAMASGGAEAFAALPDDLAARIAADHRVPTGLPHQIFGPVEDPDDLLLLRLGYDDIMEWRWKDGGSFEFRISRQDAAAGEWNRARLTFEPG